MNFTNTEERRDVQLHALLTLVHTAINHCQKLHKLDVQFTTEDILRNQALICLTNCNLTGNEENIYSVSNSYEIKQSTAILPAIYWSRKHVHLEKK